MSPHSRNRSVTHSPRLHEGDGRASNVCKRTDSVGGVWSCEAWRVDGGCGGGDLRVVVASGSAGLEAVQGPGGCGAGSRASWAGEQPLLAGGYEGPGDQAAPGAVRGFWSDPGMREVGGGGAGVEPGHAGVIAEGSRLMGAASASGPASAAS